MAAAPRWLRAAGREALVLLGYLLVTLVVTWPLASHFSRAVPGGSTAGDNWQFYWNLWWVKRALVELQASPWFTGEVFHPFGSPLYFHTLHLVPSVMVLPLVAPFGLVAAYNATIVLAFVLGGYGTYRLVLEMLPRGEAAARWAAFTAGTAFSFATHHSMRMTGQLNLLSAQWVPFFVLFLWRLWRRPSAADAAAAAGFLALASLTDWHYTLFLFVYAAVFAAWHAVADRGRGVARRLAALAGALALAVVMMWPALGPALRVGRHGYRVDDPRRSSVEMSAAVLSYAVPGPVHPLWRPGMPVLASAGVFPGYVLWGLAALALWWRWPHARFWTACAGVFVALSFGPVLQLARAPVHVLGSAVPLPFAALQAVPYLDLFRAPSRFALMAGLCLAVLAGGGTALLAARVRRAPMPLLFVLLNALLLAENRPLRYLPSRPRVPPFYAALAATPGRGALLEVPVSRQGFEDAERMLYQTVHGRPIFGGYLSRGRPPLPLDALPGFAELGFAGPPGDDIITYDPAARPAIGRALLAGLGASHVVLERARLGPARGCAPCARAEALLGPPAYADGDTIAFAVPADTAAPPFVFLGRGWSPAQAGPGGVPYRALAEGSLGVHAPQAARYEVTLRARAAGGPRRVDVALDGHPLPPLSVPAAAADSAIALPPLTPGIHWLDLRCAACGEGASGAVMATSIALRRVD